MNKRKKIVFATNNAHKLEEARQILADSFDVISLSELGCDDDIPETADTLEGNALIKARWIYERYGCDCFADDTGLMVDALDGAPGVRSARYAGEDCDSTRNVARLLDEMKDKTDRSAHFSTVVALIKDGEEHCFEGRVDGRISDAPHGSAGFGYDPVFVPEESGVSFAEMKSEDKNAISHRGRAMRKLSEFLGVTLLILLMWLLPAEAGAEEWRIHSSYDGQMERIIDTPKFAYFLGTSERYEPANKGMDNLAGVLIRYDKDGDEYTLLNTMSGMSGDIVKAIEYNFDKKYLAIAYDNGKIDLLHDNGDLDMIPGLSMSSGSKIVNNISFDTQQDLIYLATDFGYFTINDRLKEVGTSRDFGQKVMSVVNYDGKLWLSTADKIIYGEPKYFNLSDFTEVADRDHVIRMTTLGEDGIYILSGWRANAMCHRLHKVDDAYQMNGVSWEGIVSMEPTNKGLLLGGKTGMRIFRENGKRDEVRMTTSDRGAYVASYDERDYWFSNGRKGISRKRTLGDGSANWSVLSDNYMPNISSAYICSSMGYSPEYGMLVRNHGFELGYSNDIDFNDLISAYKNMNWKRVSTTYNSDSKGLIFYNPNGIAIDPNNPNHVYCGSIFNGLLRLDLSDISKSVHLSKPSDFAGGYGSPEFAAVVDDPPAGAFWPIRCLFSAPVFDSRGNMWAIYVNPEYTGAAGSSKTELWYWTPEDRAASTSASNVRPFKKIVVDASLSNNPKLFALKTSANKNLLISAGNITRAGFVVYDHNGTLDDTSDDRMVYLASLYDQDGNNLEVTYVYTVYEDPQTGTVWMSTSSDIITFDPKNLFDSASVKRIKVPRNDGTNLADYLLDGVTVTQIMADASGNKWFATRGAGIVCTNAEGREILRSYNSENSGLRGDVVYSMCHNPETNSLMISTDKGLCELFLSGAGGTDSGDEVRAYPNPARPGYHGYVTIDGLPESAMVKIVDSAGALTKECGMASGGEVKWDLTNLYFKRVPAGVYFIIASSGSDTDKWAKVGKVLVID